MRQIQTSDLNAETTAYDPLFCKTCQKRGSADPEPARTLYSDCEMHFSKRITRLRLTGVWVI